ncbi:RDD family protein [Nocardioides sp. MAHUQ-72]|uniref:RDD family protein n=1 Tax=unclassified Nocardioides TaxID=2615069 RepID=UPI00361533E9
MSAGTAGGGVSPVPREARPYQGHRAGLVTRMVAAVIDAAVVALTLLAGYFGLAALLFLVDPRGFQMPHAGLFFSLASAFVVTVSYLTVSWTLSGRTYGYLVMGLRVVGRGGRALGFVGCTIRALAVALLPVGVLWVAVSRDNRSVQDLFLGTAVVYDWQPRVAHGHHPPD